MLKVSPIHAFHDNFIWCIESHASRSAIVVDPGDANVTLSYLQDNNLELAAILITHHHPDHIGGLSKLTKQYACPVYGYIDANYHGVTHPLKDGDAVTLFEREFQVISVPGHTLDHIAFYSPTNTEAQSPWLFCGDTLFSGGCGRMFEGNPEQMLASLNKFKNLPEHTQIFCAHEYTLSNLEFARHVEPGNESTASYLEHCKRLRNQGKNTIPSQLKTELSVNPFLRCNQEEVVQFAQSREPDTKRLAESDVFRLIRAAKDCF